MEDVEAIWPTILRFNLFCDDTDMSDRIECLAILGDWPLYQQSRWILEVIARRATINILLPTHRCGLNLRS